MRYEPHDYQKYAIDYIESHPFAAVLLDMGLGKTSITLTAIADLLFDSFMVHKVLVIAPLRVARDTWPAEIGKWDHLSHLTFSVAVGTEAERKAALEAKADIYVINRENVQWLIYDSGFSFDFDMVVIDELSSFKNHQSKRFKALMQVRPLIQAPRSLHHPLPAAVFHAGQGKRPDRLQLQASTRCGGSHLPADRGYHDFHEVHRPPEDAGAHLHRLQGLSGPA